MRHVLDTELFNAQDFDSTLQSDPTAALKLFRDALITANQVLVDRFHAGRAATELVYARASLVDALLTRAWALSLPIDANDIALLADDQVGPERLRLVGQCLKNRQQITAGRVPLREIGDEPLGSLSQHWSP